MSARVLSSQLPGMAGKRVRLEGWVHRVRDLGAVRFLLLRDRAGIAQVVVPEDLDLGNVGCEYVVRVDGDARPEARAPAGCEVAALRIDTIASRIWIRSASSSPVSGSSNSSSEGSSTTPHFSTFPSSRVTPCFSETMWSSTNSCFR